MTQNEVHHSVCSQRKPYKQPGLLLNLAEKRDILEGERKFCARGKEGKQRGLVKAPVGQISQPLETPLLLPAKRMRAWSVYDGLSETMTKGLRATVSPKAPHNFEVVGERLEDEGSKEVYTYTHIGS